MYQPWLDEGFARPGARRTRADFEIAATCHLQVIADATRRSRSLDSSSRCVALYMGGMGAKEQNFHKNVFDRMGYADLTDEVQDCSCPARRTRATALIPDELVDDMHIVGTEARCKEKVAAWEETGVTTLLLSLRSPDEVARSPRCSPDALA